MWWLAACAIEPQDAEGTGVEWADDEASAFVFRDDHVTNVRLTVDPDRRPAPGQVVHAALELDGARFPDVGLALAGPPDDASLVVVLDQWAPASHHGLTSFELHQHAADPTLAREATSFRAARLLGLLAPRVGFAEVWWNGRDAGAFLVVERQDAAFVARRTGDPDAVVFRPDRGFGDFGRGLLPGDVRRSRSDGPVVDDPAVGAALDEVDVLLAGPPDPDAMGAWWERVPQRPFLEYLAWEVLTGHVDGYPARWRVAVTRGPRGPRLAWLPSDAEATWTGAVPTFGGPGAARAWCEADPECRRAYADVVLEVADRADAAALPDVYRAVDGFVRSFTPDAPRGAEVWLADRPRRMRDDVLAEYPGLGP